MAQVAAAKVYTEQEQSTAIFQLYQRGSLVIKEQLESLRFLAALIDRDGQLTPTREVCMHIKRVLDACSEWPEMKVIVPPNSFALLEKVAQTVMYKNMVNRMEELKMEK